MNLTKIALATAFVAVAAQAQAATVYLTGASATSANYKTALADLCTAAGGTATQITSTLDNKNMFAVKCSTDFSGLAGINAVSFNVSGGSLTAVTSSLGTDAKQFVDVSDTSGATSTPAQASEGGFLDNDAASFDPAVYAEFSVASVPTTAAAAFSQVFGVAVSPDLYAALQAQQGITVPAGADDRLPAYQPTLTRAQYATIASEDFNGPKQLGAEFFGITTPGSNGNLDLTLCRRASTSGTQASSNQYFLNYYIGFDGAVGGGKNPATADAYFPGQGIPYSVVEGAGTGNARTCLSNPGYAVGVLSLENSPAFPAASDKKFRYVKLNGVTAFDNAGSTATAKNGTYEFWFTSQKFGATTNGTNVLNAIDAKLSTINLNGLFGNANSAAKRDSNVSPIRFD